jgi:AcrR family transcriptional regulator
MVNTRVECCMATKSRKTATRRRPRSLGREVWLEAARSALIEEGTAGIEINKLAKRLGVSRGGFYWFFQSRDQLLDELLAFWVQTSTQLFERILRSHDGNGMREYRALVDLWIDEKEYDPKWDAAVRDWARTSAAVLSAVKAVDQKRIALLERLFRDMGYRGKEAHVRARITYYHQVGYYALGVQESRRERMELLPFYTRVLTGK